MAAAEPTKIFFDMLFDYRNLNYIFKYGFYWDDEMTSLLLAKSSQRVRELVNIIQGSVYENSVITPWSRHVAGNRKKSGRLLIRQNHYRLVQNRWFQDLCGCCGSFHDDLAEDYIRDCEQKPYSQCREEEDGGCRYRKLCMFQEEREIFLKLIDGVPKKEWSLWKDKFHRKILNGYKDIIIESEGEKHLRENTWGQIFGSLDDERNCREYNRFLDMLQFFSGFTTLSVLGGFFLKRQDPQPRPSYIMLRNLPQDFEFEQEYLYRCLYAMNAHMTVIWEEDEYVPIRLIYRDRDMAGVEEHLYLEAISWTNSEAPSGRVVELPMFGGAHVRPGRRISIEIPDVERKEQETREFQVEFYYNSSTGYLLDRRRKGWEDCIIDENYMPDVVKTMKSPYYVDMETWKMDVVTYRVKICDIPGFLLFIQSFWDFASMISAVEPIPGSELVESRRQKGLIDEQESLLSVYNSDILMEEAKKREHPLPPLQAELWWLDFILKEYPGFCSIFLSQESIERIRKKLEKECSGESWFQKERFDPGRRVKDLPGRVCAKYRKIRDAIHEDRILLYEYKGGENTGEPAKQAVIVPYALEYDVVRHLAGDSKEPMDVMCYEMNEKRVIRIPYKKIITTTSIGKEDYSFSELEKLYHVLAYAIRCAAAGKRMIEKKAARLLDCMWTLDSRGEDNYNRCIRKRLLRSRSFLEEYDRFYKLCAEKKKLEAEAFFHKVFDYLQKMAREGEDTYAYEAFLLSCFTDGCRRLWQPRAGKDVREALEAIDDLWIWKLISGSPIDSIYNEIAFYNENLKHAMVSFVLREGKEEAIRRVYSVFRNFICAGEKMRDGRLRFTVSYEKFDYRKIHMAFMALDDLVEELEMADVSEIIKKRRANKGEPICRTIF